ncbi:MAG: type II toxin-antitoxin system prevent-host-death family antitoxin [Candidatus Binatia bacterium]
MSTPSRSLNLSAVKAGLSEVVRTVRRTGQSVVITVDGEPAARIAPIEGEPRRLTAAEIATVRALMDGLARIPRPSEPFDAVAAVAEGRR